ncbi:MAG: ABC transporter ATP-binding protein [Deltaproteobacteria bacterium]|nr:ABC transporter ATP-binding protein [Deltaproteobacteria bacterium]
MNDTYIYEVSDLRKVYYHPVRELEVLKGVTLIVRHGESVAVTGPSGVGKTTLLHVLGLLDEPTSGTIFLDGVNVRDLGEMEKAKIRNKRIGFVFQFFQLLPEFTALENVLMPGLIAGEDIKNLRSKSEQLLEDVGLGDRMTHRPGELSGGEQQRVAIARALVMDPDVILADEPTGNLDPETGAEIESILRNLNLERKTSLIVVTHKESLARGMDRRVALFAGKIEELQ